MAIRFLKLTRAHVRALKPGGRIVEHGIEAKRLADGDIAYLVNIMVDRQRIHRSVGKESEGTTREQAERLIEKLRTDARADRLDLPKARKTHRTFAEAVEGYLERVNNAGGKNLVNKRRHLALYLVPYFGTFRADRVTSQTVAEYVQQRLLSAKQATINRELATLSHVLNRLVEWKWIKGDDRPRFVKGAEPRKPITVLTDSDCAALMAAALADSDPHLHLFVGFGLNAAMRHSEIVAVRYDQIDFNTRRVYIPQAKAGAREQPITPALVTMLEERRTYEADPNGWVFPAKPNARTEPARASHRPTMDFGFRRAAKCAGLDPKKVTPHVMRHTAITKLIKSGVDLPTVQKISAHKTLGMVMRYSHIHGSHIDDAIAKLQPAGAGLITQELHLTRVKD